MMRRVPSSAPPTPLDNSASTNGTIDKESLPFERQNGTVLTTSALNGGRKAVTPLVPPTNGHVNFQKMSSLPLRSGKTTGPLTRVATVAPKARLQRTNRSQVHDYPPSPLHSGTSYHDKMCGKIPPIHKSDIRMKTPSESEGEAEREKTSRNKLDKQLTPMPEEIPTLSTCYSSLTGPASAPTFRPGPDLTVEIPPRPNFLEFDRANSVDDSTMHLENLVHEQLMTDILNKRTDDLWLELDDDDNEELCSVDSSPSASPNAGRSAPAPAPSISLNSQPPKSAPPCPTQHKVDSPAATCNGELTSISNGGTPTLARNMNGESQLLRPIEMETVQEIDKQSSADFRLQQSLSTPCRTDEDTLPRKDSEYRRFKSEGSTAGAPSGSHVDVAIEDLSPIADSRTTSTHRFSLIQQDSVVNPAPKTMHSHTEQVVMMHTLKTKISKYQSFINKAFDLISQQQDEKIIEGCTIINKVLLKAWMIPKVSHDLGTALCDFLRDREYLDDIIKLFISIESCEPIRMAAGLVLEECMSLNNREYVINKNYLKKIIQTALGKLQKTQEQQRIMMSLFENFFKHSTATSLYMIEATCLDSIIIRCQKANSSSVSTLKYCSLALANLSIYTCAAGRKKLIQKRVPEWLFMLASHSDDVTRYYACLSICMLASSKEMEMHVTKSGTLSLVEPFLLSHNAVVFAKEHYKYAQSRSTDWLKRLMSMLQSHRREAKSAAAFHFTMEAAIKKDQNKLDVFQEIGAIQALKEVASSPDETAAKFASEALTVIGEEVPYKLAQQVPSWTVKDVQYWVRKIGFESYVDNFAKQMVDGDLLLHLTEQDLENDIGMSSGLHRKRFIRELESLKIAADYSSVDESNLDQFLMSLSPELSVYTYQMLSTGVNRSLLASLTDELMQNACGITNPIHRLKLKQAFQDSKHPDDVEVAMLSKQIDVFISYRRSTGNQLASLIKVLLQLSGYKVFIDVDKLYAGKFDSSLLKNIQAAKHFILVLTPHSLDRLLNDHNCDDWIHKELKCAFEHNKNIIPIFDQSFEFPAQEDQIPQDIRNITKYNGVRWVHDYQEACMQKVIRFIQGELNKTSSPLSVPTKIFKMVNGHHTVAARKQISSSSAKWSAGSTTPRMNSSTKPAKLTEPPTPTFGSIAVDNKAKRKAYHSSVSTVYGS